MDPQAALNNALHAANTDDRASAREYLANYWAWRRNGGYEPAGGDEEARDIARLLRKPRGSHVKLARAVERAHGALAVASRRFDRAKESAAKQRDAVCRKAENAYGRKLALPLVAVDKAEAALLKARDALAKARGE
jgi:hypothetical protein